MAIRLLPLLWLLFAPIAGAAGFARDQLFFAGQGGEAILAVVMQRERSAEGPVAEAKAFLAWRGRWRSPFWERVALRRWPAPDAADAVAAWREAGGGRELRIDWQGGDRVRLGLRTRSAELRLDSRELLDAGRGTGPHGSLQWRSGRALLRVGDEAVRGVVVWERLAGDAVATPVFGSFEMWVLAPPGGGLLLGRDDLCTRGAGMALAVDPRGRPSRRPFEVVPGQVRREAASGYLVPVSWRLGGLSLRRLGGEAGHGSGPAGQPAVYDVSLAGGGGATGLVFHLQDRGACP